MNIFFASRFLAHFKLLDLSCFSSVFDRDRWSIFDLSLFGSLWGSVNPSQRMEHWKTGEGLGWVYGPYCCCEGIRWESGDVLWCWDDVRYLRWECVLPNGTVLMLVTLEWQKLIWLFEHPLDESSDAILWRDESSPDGEWDRSRLHQFNYYVLPDYLTDCIITPKQIGALPPAPPSLWGSVSSPFPILRSNSSPATASPTDWQLYFCSFLWLDDS